MRQTHTLDFWLLSPWANKALTVLRLALLATLLGSLLGTWAAVGLMVLGSLMLAAMFMTSIVFSFRDCFEAPDGSLALED